MLTKSFNFYFASTKNVISNVKVQTCFHNSFNLAHCAFVGLSNGVKNGSGDAAMMDIADNVFDARTEQSSAVQYFQFYGYLSQQQNMMQDFIRTSTYQRAMLSNLPDFTNKVRLSRLNFEPILMIDSLNLK